MISPRLPNLGVLLRFSILSKKTKASLATICIIPSSLYKGNDTDLPSFPLLNTNLHSAIAAKQLKEPGTSSTLYWHIRCKWRTHQIGRQGSKPNPFYCYPRTKPQIIWQIAQRCNRVTQQIYKLNSSDWLLFRFEH